MLLKHNRAKQSGIEHSSIQKGGVQYNVGAGNIGCMVCAVWYSRGRFDTSTRDDFIVWQFTVTLLYLNSSLNPFLYYWKIREVRQAVKETLRQLFCR